MRLGDEQSVQNKQNGHNYVDPQTGIRIVSNLFSLIIHRWQVMSAHGSS